jgi:hypothetical protein
MHNNEHFVLIFTIFQQFIKKMIWVYRSTFQGVWCVWDLLKSRLEENWNNGGTCTHAPPPLSVRGLMCHHYWRSISWWIWSFSIFFLLLHLRWRPPMLEERDMVFQVFGPLLSLSLFYLSLSLSFSFYCNLYSSLILLFTGFMSQLLVLVLTMEWVHDGSGRINDCCWYGEWTI